MFLAFFYRLSAMAFTVGVLFVGWLIAFSGFYFSSPKGIPSNSDVIVILGGGTGERLEKGIELYKQGFSKRLLVTGFPDLSLDVMPTHMKYRFRYLIESGIPESAITVDGTARSSVDEAIVVRNFLTMHNLKNALIVSDPPHMRRLSYIFSALSKQGNLFSYDLIASNPPWWNSQHWWKNTYAAEFVLVEVIKIAYLFISNFSMFMV